ncbi:MAG: hypothetical protein WCP21_07200 [Armatimonadota bacterium]
MVRVIVQMLVTSMLVAAVVQAVPADAQNAPAQRMWYRGAFDGWVDLKAVPQYGYYYHPSPDSAYPLNEAAYGQPIACNACGHYHFPGKSVCPHCHQRCPAGGNYENPNTVYTQRMMPGAYYYQEQPHYTFGWQMGVNNPLRKYNRPLH